MKNKIITLLTLVVTGFAAWMINVGFSSSKLDKAHYSAWVQDMNSGLHQSQIKNGLHYDLQYKPHAFEAMRFNPKMDENALEAEIATLQGLQLFTLALEAPGFNNLMAAELQNDREYADRVTYYAFDVKHDIAVIQGTDTLPCVMGHLERDYGASPKVKLTFAFEQKKEGEFASTMRFIYYDRVFNNGNIQFEFDQSTLTNIPQPAL